MIQLVLAAVLAATLLPPGVRPDPRPKPDPAACAEARRLGQTLEGCPRPENSPPPERREGSSR